jgi:ribokinase
MKKIICIGSACKDIFFPTSEGNVINTPDDLTSQAKISFELGAKYKVENRFEAIGGCAANVASGLSRLGEEAICYSKVGDDVMGEWIRKELEKSGVNISLVETETNFQSDLSSIIIDKNSGERVIFSNQKVNGTLKIEEDKIEDAEWIFIGDLHGEWEKHLDEIFAVAQKNGIRVAFNPRQSNIHDNAEKITAMMSSAEVVFLNKDEAIEIAQIVVSDESQANLNNEEFLIKKIKELGMDAIVLTDGKNGVWGCIGEEIVHVEASKEKAVDSTGAGDAFASGFLASYIKDNELGECLRWGIANGGSVVNFYGGTAGLLGIDEIKIRAMA